MAKLGTFTHIPPESWLFQDYGDVRQARENALRYQQAHGSSHSGERNIEEFVRQWAISRLIEGYGYPSDWLGSRLIIELFVAFGSRYGQADIALLHPDGYPFAIIEIKPLNTSEYEFRKAQRIRSGRGDCPRFDLRKSAEFGILPLWTSHDAPMN